MSRCVTWFKALGMKDSDRLYLYALSCNLLSTITA